jgi:hypothetical protein
MVPLSDPDAVLLGPIYAVAASDHTHKAQHAAISRTGIDNLQFQSLPKAPTSLPERNDKDM